MRELNRIRAANKRQMLERLERLRQGKRANQKPLRLVKAPAAGPAITRKQRGLSEPVPTGHCCHLRDRLQPTPADG